MAKPMKAPLSGGWDDMNDMDQTRQEALDAITSAFAHGHITMEDYEARAEKIQKAKLPVEIDAQIPGLRAASRRSAPTPVPADDFFVEERHGSPDFSLCVMGEIRILVPRGLPVRMSAFPFMGSIVVKAV
ncbi:MAG TPA: hypothetical protein DIT55_00605 [Spirochaetaceae bacterium]|nr:hypothetical protein [Spirochaetaceae bacterium]